MTVTPSARYAAPLLIVGCVIFGLGSLIVKFVPLGAYAIAFWRLAVSAVVFWLLSRYFGQRLPKSRKGLNAALMSGGFLAFDLALWHESIYAVGPGIATLLNSLQIFFLSAVGVLFFRERLSGLQIFSLMMAVAGVALIASPEFGHNGEALWGFASGLVSGAMLALSMVYLRQAQQTDQTPLFPLMMVVSAAGALILVPFALWFDAGALYPETWRDVGLVLVYGVVMQCFAWGLIAYALPLLSLSLTGLLLLSEPVAALFIDYFLLGKPINGLQWGGAALTLLAIYLGSLKGKAH